ncbi:MAG: glycosyltransferase, partial [Anaerolineales bacterium]
EPDTENTLLFFGNLSYRPNVDGVKHFCSHTYPEIQKQINQVSLHIIGNQPARVVQHLKRKPGVKITGWVPSLIEYIASVTAVVSPMRIGVGFPNKVAESLALGKAVVCTDIGCRGLPGSDQVLLVAHNDKEFIQATVELLRDPDLRKQMEKRAWTYARESINPNTALAALDSVYAKL